MMNATQRQRDAFKEFMKSKKRENGSNYAINTVNSYVSALATAPPKLHGVSLVATNLYDISSRNEFIEEREKIKSAENYDKINKETGSKALQYALDFYEQFLVYQEGNNYIPASQFTWTSFYEKVANEIGKYRDKRTELLEMLHNVFARLKIEDPLNLAENVPSNDICPFTVMGLFNSPLKQESRIAIAKELAEIFEIKVPVPESLEGIPMLDPQESWLSGRAENLVEYDSDSLWSIFITAIILISPKNNFKKNYIKYFENLFDKLTQQNYVKLDLTTALYWIRPWAFLPLDEKTQQFLTNKLSIPCNYRDTILALEYIELIESMKIHFDEVDYPVHSFPELSYKAWLDEKADSLQDISDSQKENKAMDKNIILYGPPGTGKTYNTVAYAVAIIEDTSPEEIQSEIESAGYNVVLDRYRKYKSDGQIAFTTFHQSYGYEEFIEGIKPVMDGESTEDEGEKQLSYELKAGSFKAFCETAKSPIVQKFNHMNIGTAPTIWKMSLGSARENPIKRDCFTHDRVRIAWDDMGKDITEETVFVGGQCSVRLFVNEMDIGDLVLILYDQNTIDAIGVIMSEYEWLESESTYRRSRKVKWLVKDIRENILEYNENKVLDQGSVYRLHRFTLDAVRTILAKYIKINTEEIQDNKNNYVFIIDEINRGNISKIFGELITLIETSKRIGGKEEMWAKLPYSQVEFGVPSNVYILGTMNTADRSISMIDTALRRRFHFEEMMPDPNVLKDIDVEGISISAMLAKMNQRIEVLYDREHTIGHAYFIDLKDDPSMKMLSCIFKNAIIPLLQEYFFEDYQKIQLVLGDNTKEEKLQFIHTKQIDIISLFGNQSDLDFEDKKVYEINSLAFENSDAYRKIYS